jgi:hypothetical protein
MLWLCGVQMELDFRLCVSNSDNENEPLRRAHAGVGLHSAGAEKALAKLREVQESLTGLASVAASGGSDRWHKVAAC